MKKSTRLIALIVCIAMALAIIVPSLIALTAYAAVDDSTVRVKLSNANDGTINIGVTGTFVIEQNGQTINSDVILVQNGSSFSLNDKRTGASYYSGTSMKLRNQSGQGLLKLYTTANGNRQYLGDMLFKADGSKTTVINYVPIEQYLYGVVAYEMSNEFPLEALKAQAICARCYVIGKMNSKREYDVVDTTTDQVYKGFNATQTNVINAVDATRGQVLKHNGKVITAFFGATNGGQTELSQNPWDKTMGYLEMKDDPYDMKNSSSPVQKIFFPTQVSDSTPLAPAAERFLKDQVAPELAKRGYSVYSDQIQITGIPSMQAYSPKYSAPSRSYTKAKASVSVRAVRTGSGGSSPDLDNQFQGAKPQMPSFTPLLDAFGNAMFSGDGPLYIESTGRIVSYIEYTSIMNQYENALREWQGGAVGTPGESGQGMVGQVDNLTVDIDFVIYDIKSKTLPYKAFTNHSLIMYYTEPTADGTNLVNARYGHGVGMSQRGAQQMANEGWDYRRILDFYYVNTNFETLDYQTPIAPTDNGSFDGIVFKPDEEPTGDSGDSSSSDGLIVENDADNAVRLDPTKFFGQMNTATKLYKDKTMKTVIATIPADYVVEIQSSTNNKSAYNVIYKAKKGVVSAKNLTRLVKGSVHPNPGQDEGAPIISDTPPIIPPSTTTSPDSTVNSGTSAAVNVTGTPKVSSVNVRVGASTETGIVAQLLKGDVVTIGGQVGDFYFVVMGNGTVGYVAKEYMTIKQPNVGIVTGRTINVRSGANTNADVLEVLDKGQIVAITAKKDGFYKIVTPSGTVGYASMDYMKPTKAPVPTIAGNGGGDTPSQPTPQPSPTPAPSATPKPSASTAKVVATGKIKNDDVNLRAQGNTSAEILMVMQKGTKVDIYAQTSDFYKVGVGGKTGYVSKPLVVDVKMATGSSNTSSSTSGSASGSSSSAKKGVVTASKLKARTQSGSELFSMKKGDVVDIISAEKDKYKIKFNGNLGYVESKYISTKALAKGKVLPDGLNMRKEMDTGSALLVTIPQNATVEIVSTSGEWMQVYYDAKTGYVKGEYIQK